jgi:signal transduction histidine kinase
LIARIDTLNQIVTDILTYAKPNPPKPQRLNVQALVSDVAATARAAVPGVSIEAKAESAVAIADPEMSRAVLLNLVLNAAQAMGTGATKTTGAAANGVEVHATCAETSVAISILDRGPGLPPQVRERLFQPFVTTRSGGTGLGLAIAHRLTVLQGGTLTLEPRAGGGTVVTLTLPLADARTA